MRNLHRIFALSALALLVACGNQTDRGTGFKNVSKRVFNKVRGGEAATAPSQAQIAASINAALAATNKPLTLAVVENRDGFALLTQVASNGGYKTWGSADKRSIVTKSGMITATRGLGFDLMSAHINNSLAAVSRRQSGSTQRRLNFLDGENRTVTMSFDCTTKVGGTQQLAIGAINSKVTAVTESCRGDGASFDNSYQVSPSGRILQSRQWLGPQTGYVFLQALRQ